MGASAHIVPRSTYVSTKLQYFGHNFNARIMHAVGAVRNLLQEAVAGGVSLIFSDFSVHKPQWSYE